MRRIKSLGKGRKVSNRELIDALIPPLNEGDRGKGCPRLEELGDFVSGHLSDRARKKRIRAHLRECQQCWAQMQALKSMMAIEAGVASPPDDDPPRHIIDMPFVQSVRDVATYIERAFAQKHLKTECRLTVVPDFYKERLLSSGLQPQQYLARFFSVLAEILPPGETLTVDADTSAFIIRLPNRDAEYYLSDGEFRKGRAEGGKTIDPILLLACYTIWLDEGTRISPAAFSFPLPEAERIPAKATLENLLGLNEFFSDQPHLRWRPRDRYLLSGIADSLREGSLPRELLIHPPAAGGKAPSTIPWPALFAVMTALPESERNLRKAAQALRRERERHIKEYGGPSGD